MITRKVAPALAAGCVFIAKPAEQSPLTALYMEYLWYQTGAPAGTFVVLPAANPVPVSQVLLQDERVRKLSFTGSTEVGKLLYAQAAATVKRISLELGGHAPFLIFEDADLALAVKEVIACKFRNAGQTCVCTNHIYVHESVATAFIEQIVQAAQQLKVGDPLDQTTQIGPLVDAAGLAKVEAHDQEEAMTMSDRIAVFNRGKIEQVGTPADIYERPTTEFVYGTTGNLPLAAAFTLVPIVIITSGSPIGGFRCALVVNLPLKLLHGGCVSRHWGDSFFYISRL